MRHTNHIPPSSRNQCRSRHEILTGHTTIRVLVEGESGGTFLSCALSTSPQKKTGANSWEESRTADDQPQSLIAYPPSPSAHGKKRKQNRSDSSSYRTTRSASQRGGAAGSKEHAAKIECYVDRTRGTQVTLPFPSLPIPPPAFIDRVIYARR